MEKVLLIIAIILIAILVIVVNNRPMWLKTAMKSLVSELEQLEIYADKDIQNLALSKGKLESFIKILDSIEDARILRYLHRNIPSLFRQSQQMKKPKFERRMKRLLPKLISKTQSLEFQKINEILSEIEMTSSEVYTKLGMADDELQKIQLSPTKVDWRAIRREIKKTKGMLNSIVPCRWEHGTIPNYEDRMRMKETSNANCTTCMSGQCPFNINPNSDKRQRQPE
jgi:hypothetical protein